MGKRKPPAGSTLPARGLRLAGEPGSSVSAPSCATAGSPSLHPFGVSAVRAPVSWGLGCVQRPCSRRGLRRTRRRARFRFRFRPLPRLGPDRLSLRGHPLWEPFRTRPAASSPVLFGPSLSLREDRLTLRKGRRNIFQRFARKNRQIGQNRTSGAPKTPPLAPPSRFAAPPCAPAGTSGPLPGDCWRSPGLPQRAMLPVRRPPSRASDLSAGVAAL